MDALEIGQFVQCAEQLYAAKLRDLLEPHHTNEFVVIEPKSGDYFVAGTLRQARSAAQERYPDRLTHAMRVGHPAALHFGMQLR